MLTSATAELARLILMDSAKIQFEQARRRRRKQKRPARRDTGAEATRGPASDDDAEFRLRSQPPAVATRDTEPLYDLDAVAAAVDHFHPVRYGQPMVVAAGVTATFEDAGHILGSAIIILDVEEAGRVRRLVFTGDLGRPGTPIIDDPTAVTGGADYVITESTYGGRHHEPADDAVRELAEAVRDTAERKGVLLIPAFAVGPTCAISSATRARPRRSRCGSASWASSRTAQPGGRRSSWTDGRTAQGPTGPHERG